MVIETFSSYSNGGNICGRERSFVGAVVFWSSKIISEQTRFWGFSNSLTEYMKKICWWRNHRVNLYVPGFMHSSGLDLNIQLQVQSNRIKGLLPVTNDCSIDRDRSPNVVPMVLVCSVFSYKLLWLLWYVVSNWLCCQISDLEIKSYAL